jgi:hypothetical protein
VRHPAADPGSSALGLLSPQHARKLTRPQPLAENAYFHFLFLKYLFFTRAALRAGDEREWPGRGWLCRKDAARTSEAWWRMRIRCRGTCTSTRIRNKATPFVFKEPTRICGPRTTRRRHLCSCTEQVADGEIYRGQASVRFKHSWWSYSCTCLLPFRFSVPPMHPVSWCVPCVGCLVSLLVAGFVASDTRRLLQRLFYTHQAGGVGQVLQFKRPESCTA